MLPREHPDASTPTASTSPSTITAGWPMPGCCCLLPWPSAGLGELANQHVDLGDASGDKPMTLVGSALAGGDCIDDSDALRCGNTKRVLECVVKALSTLGTFLRSSRWGHVRQLVSLSRELLAPAWTAGAGPTSPRALPTSGGRRWAAALRWGQGRTHGTVFGS